jgi:hypothetical protein
MKVIFRPVMKQFRPQKERQTRRIVGNWELFLIDKTIVSLRNLCSATMEDCHLSEERMMVIDLLGPPNIIEGLLETHF